MKLPATLKPESILVTVDNREQQPWDLAPLRTECGTFQSGDYSLAAAGLTDLIRVERKSLPDLIGVVGRGRDRCEREIERMQAFPCRVLIVEASWSDVDAGDWLGKVTPKMARNSFGSWMVRGLNVVMAGHRRRAEEIARELLYRTALHEYRKLRSVAAGIEQ